MKELHFIAGLPRSGSTMLASILHQNPQVHSEAVSGLHPIFSSVHANWNEVASNNENPNPQARMGVLNGILSGYYNHIDRPIVIDKDRGWISNIGLVEAVTRKRSKIICMVRNPAEILASFEKIRKSNPMDFVLPDKSLRERSTVAGRAYFYSAPEGALGSAHQGIKDAVTMGYLDRLLFVDYSRFCNSPKSQLKRIYEFLELPTFEHDLKNIAEIGNFNDIVVGLPNLHKIKPTLERTTINAVEYLGLELYQQYNKDIFWDAWI
jgi:sulfotransferase